MYNIFIISKNRRQYHENKKATPICLKQKVSKTEKEALDDKHTLKKLSYQNSCSILTLWE